MVAVFLADGFEEIEATAPIDLLRRAKIETLVVGVGKLEITSARNMRYVADISTKELADEHVFEAVVLPGGLPGATNLEACPEVLNAVQNTIESGGLIAAICAAPVMLANWGVLENKRATVFPAHKDKLKENYLAEPIVTDFPFITANAAGAAIDFALELIKQLRSQELMCEIKNSIYYR